MPKLYYCNTIYDAYKGVASSPVMHSDLNPLLLQRYKDGSILVLCARQGQARRINLLLEEPEYQNRLVIAFGWWDADTYGLVQSGIIMSSDIYCYDAVVILDRHRISEKFESLVKEVESLCIN